MNANINFMPKLNSYGAVICQVFIPFDLLKSLKRMQEFCLATKIKCTVSDNKTGLVFNITKDGISLFPEFVEFQGPSLPVAKKAVIHQPMPLSPIYPRKDVPGAYQGD